MNWEEVCHWIAQGAVNIAEGHTTIEADSRVHVAMKAFCEMVTQGYVIHTVEKTPPAVE